MAVALSKAFLQSLAKFFHLILRNFVPVACSAHDREVASHPALCPLFQCNAVLAVRQVGVTRHCVSHIAGYTT